MSFDKTIQNFELVAEEMRSFKTLAGAIAIFKQINFIKKSKQYYKIHSLKY